MTSFSRAIGYIGISTWQWIKPPVELAAPSGCANGQDLCRNSRHMQPPPKTRRHRKWIRRPSHQRTVTAALHYSTPNFNAPKGMIPGTHAGANRGSWQRQCCKITVPVAAWKTLCQECRGGGKHLAGGCWNAISQRSISVSQAALSSDCRSWFIPVGSAKQTRSSLHSPTTM